MIQGVHIATITPRRPQSNEIDISLVFEVVDFLAARRVPGLALLGSTGEFLHFGLEDRSRLANFVIKRSRVPVLVNVSHSTLDGAVQLGVQAMRAGAAGLLLMPPYFFAYSPEEIARFYREFARAMGRSTPVLLYNIPVFTNDVPVQTARELLESGVCAGIKDSGGRVEYLEALMPLASTHPVSLLVGNDTVFVPVKRMGAHGLVTGVGCALPELMMALNAAIVSSDSGRTDRLEAFLHEFIAWINRFPTPIGVREAVAARGLRVGPSAIPLCEGRERQLAAFREWFQGWLPGVLAACQ